MCFKVLPMNQIQSQPQSTADRKQQQQQQTAIINKWYIHILLFTLFNNFLTVNKQWNAL